jgi:hypothetical protein
MARIGRPSPSINYADVRRRLEAGETPAAIAREFGIYRTSIVKGARRAGYTGEFVRGRFEKLDARNELIVRALMAGEAPKRVAHRFGLSISGLRKTLARSGFSLRAMRTCRVSSPAIPMVKDARSSHHEAAR